MTAPTREPHPAATPTARQLAWQRRRQSAARTWAEFRRHRSGIVGLAILVLFAVVAVGAPLIADRSGLEVTEATGGVLDEPSWSSPLSTDADGRSVLTLLIWGARISLAVGLLATAISMLLGTLIGLASGHYRNWIGNMLFRLTEWFLVVPFLPLAIVLVSLLGPSLLTLAFVIGVTSWPGTALLIRAQTLSIEARPYLERARVLGAGDWRQMSRHVLPNVMPMVIANTTLTVVIAILSETALSFIGLGDPARVSWLKIEAFRNKTG